MSRLKVFLLTVVLVSFPSFVEAHDWMAHVDHQFAENEGVKIHYAVAGKGPLVVFIHGWPDFWYSWHHQMEGLADEYRVAALDTRGYNKSDQPQELDDYAMPKLVADVAAVVKKEGREKAIIIGHDWGGVIAWHFAAAHPEITEKLVIVNLPHPKNLARELMNNPQQEANSAYARNFQKPDSHKGFNPTILANIVAGKDKDMQAKYKAAFEKSSMNGMMNYYRKNYPRAPYTDYAKDFPTLNMPVLQFHGLNDTALLHSGLNGTWEHLEKDYTLVTIPNVGHWAHHEAPDLVTDSIKWWLSMRK
jgi:pimeloyl-ACP methyl ester carboxylesterase